MSKGIVVCGYPGTGKSSIAGYKKTIDLESSFFSDRSDKNWSRRYASVAIDIARQGYTVFVSTHKEVLEQLFAAGIPEESVKIVIFCPPRYWKQEWISRLDDRYKQNPCPKNLKALERVRNFYNDDIFELVNNERNWPVFQPEAMDYDLRNYVSAIQYEYLDNWKEVRDGEAN